MTNRLSKILLTLCAAVPLLFAGVAGAASQQTGRESDAQLVQRIKTEVIKDLRESGALDKEIDAGIRRFIAREQAKRRRAANRDRAEKLRAPSVSYDHILGDPKAPISLIEYSDFECPFCKRFHLTAHAVVKSYGGKVNWVYRYFPLGFHNPAAEREAEAAECVAALGGNSAFWKFADGIYANTASNGEGVPTGRLESLAKDLGIDTKRFDQCLEKHRYAARVKNDLREGKAIGIQGTPGNTLRNNGTGEIRLRPGARPLQALKADIDDLLK